MFHINFKDVGEDYSPRKLVGTLSCGLFTRFWIKYFQFIHNMKQRANNDLMNLMIIFEVNF